MNCTHCHKETNLDATGPYLTYLWTNRDGTKVSGPAKGVHACCEECTEGIIVDGRRQVGRLGRGSGVAGCKRGWVTGIGRVFALGREEQVTLWDVKQLCRKTFKLEWQAWPENQGGVEGCYYTDWNTGLDECQIRGSGNLSVSTRGKYGRLIATLKVAGEGRD